jgi:flagellin
MSVINTNVKALVAQNALTVNNRVLSKSMEQLSTGKRINSAADDAAGLAISNKMTSQIRGLNQAVRNANDAISMIQTAEGALGEVNNMLQRMRELAVQSANDTNSSDDRKFLQLEVAELILEIDRISENTQFNKMEILDNTGTNAVGLSAGTAIFQIGANGTNTNIQITFNNVDSTTLGVNGIDIELQADAQDAIDTIDLAIKDIDTDRATYGATINRLTYAADNMANISANTAASRSRVLDADYAQVTTELARAQIIQQAGTAMLAQANQQPASVLSLLQ